MSDNAVRNEIGYEPEPEQLNQREDYPRPVGISICVEL